MKDHIDLNIYMEKKKNSSSGFWGAAKKWHIWKQKHNTSFTTILPVEKPVFSWYRETQSETQPRFSLNLGRISFDGPKYSTFDAPRASWDGGRTNLPRIFDENAPGGSDQTRDYYLDSSSKRRKSLDRSTSLRNTADSMVSPTTAHYLKVLPNTNDPNTISLRVACKDTLDGKESKKSRKWNWKLWGLLNRHRGRNKDGEEDAAYTRVNGVDRSLSDLRREGSGFNGKMFRSNSSVSWRNANILGGPIDLGRKSAVEMNELEKKRRDNFGLEKNPSTRYSQNHVANRFYLTPTEGQQKRSG